MLFDGFPKNVATTFSTKWNAEFPPINRIKLADLQKAAAKKSVMIVGGPVSVHKEVLDWMLASCAGKGLVQAPNTDWRQFSHYHDLRICADMIGCNGLVQAAERQMTRIADNQIHSEDVRAVWSKQPSQPKMQQFLARHIAHHTLNRTLHAKGTYSTLREEIPELHEAINKIIEEEKAAKKKAKEDQLKERKAVASGSVGHRGDHTPIRGGHRGFQGGRPQNGHRLARPEHKTPIEHTKGIAPVSAEKRVVLKAEIVRRAKNGRPAFAKLDLKAVGITKEQFYA